MHIGGVFERWWFTSKCNEYHHISTHVFMSFKSKHSNWLSVFNQFWFFPKFLDDHSQNKHWNHHLPIRSMGLVYLSTIKNQPWFGIGKYTPWILEVKVNTTISPGCTPENSWLLNLKKSPKIYLETTTQNAIPNCKRVWLGDFQY